LYKIVIKTNKVGYSGRDWSPRNTMNQWVDFVLEKCSYLVSDNILNMNISNREYLLKTNKIITIFFLNFNESNDEIDVFDGEYLQTQICSLTALQFFIIWDVHFFLSSNLVDRISVQKNLVDRIYSLKWISKSTRVRT
jgi:hypothetical protein